MLWRGKESKLNLVEWLVASGWLVGCCRLLAGLLLAGLLVGSSQVAGGRRCLLLDGCCPPGFVWLPAGCCAEGWLLASGCVLLAVGRLQLTAGRLHFSKSIIEFSFSLKPFYDCLHMSKFCGSESNRRIDNTLHHIIENLAHHTKTHISDVCRVGLYWGGKGYFFSVITETHQLIGHTHTLARYFIQS